MVKPGKTLIYTWIVEVICCRPVNLKIQLFQNPVYTPGKHLRGIHQIKYYKNDAEYQASNIFG